MSDKATLIRLLREIESAENAPAARRQIISLFDAIGEESVRECSNLRTELAAGNHLYAQATDKINDLEAQLAQARALIAKLQTERDYYYEEFAILREKQEQDRDFPRPRSSSHG